MGVIYVKEKEQEIQQGNKNMTYKDSVLVLGAEFFFVPYLKQNECFFAF